jgi:hypothetical protein
MIICTRLMNDDFQLYDEEEHTGLYVQQLMDDDE